MANGFDRLERLFAKRKTSVNSSESGDHVLPAPAGPAPEPQFPSPSFIRPKATRMSAREEVRLKQANSLSVCRPVSILESLEPERKEPAKTPKSSSTRDSYSLYPSPQKPRSLKTRQPKPVLQDFRFPRPPTRNGEASPASSISDTKSSLDLSGQQTPNTRSPRKTQAGGTSYRLDTPPSSDLEDNDSSSPKYFRHKKLPALPPRGAPPTPGQSPELSPVLDSQLIQHKSTASTTHSKGESISRQLAEEARQQPSLRSSRNSSSLAPSLRLSLSSSTLREPDFNDFLNLSDDDIAETSPDSPMAPSADEFPSPPTSLVPAVPAARKQTLLTLTPPYASRPATVAAHEATRIASKYNFDLVYVVNLWPEGNKAQKSCSDCTDTASILSDSSSTSFAGMTGRLLAASGLHHVKSPFQISAAVHGKILNSDGWIEYRNQEAGVDEFARGYACAFHKNNSSQDGPSAVDRGIVFAAYRKPQADGSMQDVGSSKAELEQVYRDAEALVEMLVDIHVADQLRQPSTHCHHADKIGPMPI